MGAPDRGPTHSPTWRPEWQTTVLSPRRPSDRSGPRGLRLPPRGAPLKARPSACGEGPSQEVIAIMMMVIMMVIIIAMIMMMVIVMIIAIMTMMVIAKV